MQDKTIAPKKLGTEFSFFFVKLGNRMGSKSVIIRLHHFVPLFVGISVHHFVNFVTYGFLFKWSNMKKLLYHDYQRSPEKDEKILGARRERE